MDYPSSRKPPGGAGTGRQSRRRGGLEAHALSGEVIGAAKTDAVGVKWEVVVPTVRVLPKFPVEWATTKHGPCVVRVVLDEYGVPASAEVVTCDEVFQAAALEAARGWRFEFDADTGRSTRGRRELGSP